MGAAKSNRAALVGVGGWGCRALAHVWPRLRLADERRSLITPDLPPIHHTVSFALVLPDPGSAGQPPSVRIAHPRPGRWDTATFAEMPWHSVVSSGPGYSVSPADRAREITYQRLADDIEVLATYTPPATPRNARAGVLQALAAHESIIQQQLLWMMDQARVDRGEPTAEISKLTIYLLASLAEDIASILLWPLATLLRQGVGEYTPIEIVGLFQADSFALPPTKLYEDAAIYLALEEMAQLEASDRERQAGLRATLPGRKWLDGLGEHPFDHRYLLSREKVGGTMAADEGEIIAMIGNALEAFLLSDADRFLSERLAPDLPLLHAREGYSSLGAASIYVPVEVMRARSRDQVRLQLLHDHFLARLTPDQTEQAEQLATTLYDDLLCVRQLELALIADAPFELGAPPGPSRGRKARQAPFIPVRLRPGELQPPLSGTEGLGPDARLEAIHQHFAQMEGARLARWRQELLMRAGALPAPTIPSDIGVEEGEEAEATPPAPRPGQTAVNYLLEQMDNFLLDLVRQGGRGSLRLAMACAQRAADLLHQESDALAAQRSAMAIPPGLRNLTSSAEVNWIEGALARWSLVHQHPGWVFLSLLVLSLVAATILARAAGAGPGQLTAGSLLWLVVGAVVLGGAAAIGLLALARNRLQQLGQALIRAKGKIIDRQINDLVYELTVNAHALLLEEVRARAAHWQRVIDELTAEEAQLAAILARPMTAESSFVRTAVLDMAIYDGIWARARRWVSGRIVPRLWDGSDGRTDDLRSAWQDTLAGIAAEPTLDQLGARPALSWSDQTGARAPLTEAISAAIARYAAVVSKPYLPPGASVESSLARSTQGSETEALRGKEGAAGWQIDDLSLRARPCIRFEEAESDLEVLVAIDLAAMPYTMSRWIGRESGAARRVHPVPSSDPFSITVVRTLHGLIPESLPQLRHYAQEFAQLDAEALRRLVVSPALARMSLPDWEEVPKAEVSDP